MRIKTWPRSHWSSQRADRTEGNGPKEHCVGPAAGAARRGEDSGLRQVVGELEARQGVEERLATLSRTKRLQRLLEFLVVTQEKHPTATGLNSMVLGKEQATRTSCATFMVGVSTLHMAAEEVAFEEVTTKGE